MNLVNGGAFHDAVAFGLATPADHNWDKALEVGRVRFDEGVKAAGFLDIELFKVEQHWQVVEKMVQLYRDNYGQENYTIIQPECSFDITLPNTYHNCIFVHHLELTDIRPGFSGYWVERWGPPTPEAIMEKRVMSPHTLEAALIMGHQERTKEQCACWQPHRLVGKTDALVKWQGNIWLLEHKTSAIKGDQFWDQWDLDVQPTTYMYGIWKSIGLRPRGFVLDMIYKPSEKQIESWNARRKYGNPKNVLDYMEYERRPFLRTEEDLARVEQQYIELMNEWESRIAGPLGGHFPLANVGHACKLYNRKCDFWTACLTHDDQKEFDVLAQRAYDYVDEKLVQITPGAKLEEPVPTEVIELVEGYEL